MSKRLFKLTKEMLQEKYDEGLTGAEIAKELGLARSTVSKWTRIHKIRNPAKKSDLENLLEETPESYYWLGFLLADGTFILNPRGNKITLGVSEKDVEHLKKYKDFIGHRGKMGTRVHKPNKDFKNTRIEKVVSSGCKTTVPLVVEKLKTGPNKTYHPPDRLPRTRYSLLLCFLIGFIDGDGSVRKNTRGVSIQCHSSWVSYLQLIANLLYENKKTYVNTQKKATLLIGDIPTMLFLKRHGIKYNLPVLSRKWDRIQLNKNKGHVCHAETHAGLVDHEYLAMMQEESRG